MTNIKAVDVSEIEKLRKFTQTIDGMKESRLGDYYYDTDIKDLLDRSPSVSAPVEENSKLLIEAMENGYSIQCHEPCAFLTDEANNKHRWSVSRTMAPFCDKSGQRVWTGSTVYEALNQAKNALLSANQGSDKDES